MRFVGLDVSYRHVGLVVLDESGEVVGLEHLQCKSKAEVEGYAWHLTRASEWLERGDVVAIEGMSFGSKGRMNVLAGAYAMWVTIAAVRSQYVFVPVPIRVKLWALGTHKASKEDMVAWAEGVVGRAGLSEHEADALAIAQIARASFLHLQGVLDVTTLTAKQHTALENKDGTGLVQALNKSYYRGAHGRVE